MSSKYIQTLLALLPSGSAWNKSSSSNLYKFLDGFTDELQLADDRIVQLSIEANPGTASETLGDWERILGLPEDGDEFYPTDDEGRRQAIVSKLNGYTAPSIASVKVMSNSSAQSGKQNTPTLCRVFDMIFMSAQHYHRALMRIILMVCFILQHKAGCYIEALTPMC